ncbi:MAG: FKBP-type peptidyl-prolyl cis-trans isomerase [Hymenobacter sp.]
MYVLTTKPGTGPNAKPGQLVTVDYRGTLLDGKEFDASAKHGGQPFSFALGRGQVIPGWDDALQQLSKGSKATILIPSSLAYGKQGLAARHSGQLAPALRRGADQRAGGPGRPRRDGPAGQVMSC